MSDEDPLQVYRKKRHFERTPEPQGGSEDASEQPVFVIQKHDASSLHYDFRLEVEGVLKSWVVPKGPSTDPSERRLALPTEDHPLNYADFEGVIPEDEYGAGTVMVWDIGPYENLRAQKDKDGLTMAEAYADGKIEVWLDGKKLQGGYVLVRTDSGEDERWLLIKMDDEEADARRNPTSTEPKSVLSEWAWTRSPRPRKNEPMKEVFERLDEAAQQKLEATAQPDWMEPMLARLTDDPFSDPAWIYERKVDGERCLAFRQDDTVRLLSRNQKSLNTQYPEIATALLKTVPGNFILDGEVVAFEGGVTSFSRLQERMHVSSEAEARDSGIAVYYYLFDILYLSDRKTTQVPLRQRKMLLKYALDFSDPLRFLAHRNEAGEALLEEACRKGWEGVIAKQADWPYVHRRSSKWLKFKCVNRQEFVIGGYTEPHGERIAFGALLIGYYEGGDLLYAGKVGTGYDDDTLKRLGARLAELEQAEPSFADSNLPKDEVHWVRPDLVAEVGFSEWTDYGKLRHPRYLGLRPDKEPQDVHRERPT